MNTLEKYAHLMKPADESGEAIKRLEEIIAILRVECPWDRKQTHESLITPLIEESYELVDAIKNKDFSNMREELGDVLLQVVFHANMTKETKKFTLTDVINEECEKMIRRHPHVFSVKNGENSTKTVDKVLEKWQNIKRQEKGETDIISILENVPKNFPALLRADKLQAKAASFGFDWPDYSGAMEKLDEELNEVKDAIASGDKRAISEELGDLMFSIVNLCRLLKVNPETSLNDTSDKFIERIRVMEEIALAEGTSLEGKSLDELDQLWDAAKNVIKKRRTNNE